MIPPEWSLSPTAHLSQTLFDESYDSSNRVWNYNRVKNKQKTVIIDFILIDWLLTD